MFCYTKISLCNYIHSTITKALQHPCTHSIPIAIDATAGNGHDTLFLAKTICKEGHVFAFDIQKEAILSTFQRLSTNTMSHKVSLFHIGHETLQHSIALATYNKNITVQAIMFNLGYLPASTKECITLPHTTVQALTASITLLSIGGILSIHTYHGHKGGYEEYCAVDIWCKALPVEKYTVFSIEQINKRSHREVAYIIQKCSH